jgi:hypothetical protein
MAAVQVPAASRVRNDVGDASFYDAFAVDLRDDGKTALELYLSAVKHTPRWIEAAMAVRNRIVRLCGLKDLGKLGGIELNRAAATYKRGDRVGIFTIEFLSDDEVVLGDADKHLRARISVYRERGSTSRVICSTVVHVNNLLGRVYLCFVVPVHKLIVPAMLSRIPQAR